MSGESAFQICESFHDAESMSKQLLQTALSNHKCNDNITIIVVILSSL